MKTEVEIKETERNTILAFAYPMGKAEIGKVKFEIIVGGATIRTFVEQEGKETREFDFEFGQVVMAIYNKVKRDVADN